MKSPSIPEAPARTGVEFDRAVKEVIEVMKGRRPGVRPITKLAAGASTDDIINKLNELIDRVQQ